VRRCSHWSSASDRFGAWGLIGGGREGGGGHEEVISRLIRAQEVVWQLGDSGEVAVAVVLFRRAIRGERERASSER
jgi:hypothetical protein